MLLAYATLAQPPPPEWLDACVEHAMGAVDGFDAQAVANAVWALALLDRLQPDTWNALLRRFEEAPDGRKSAPLGLSGHAALTNMWCQLDAWTVSEG